VFCWLAHTRGETSPSHVDPSAVQFTHALPALPQLPLAKPGTHALAAVQHPRQFAALHLSRHWRPWQIWFVAVQSLHARPLRPQSASWVPSTHVLPEQHPAQLPGPQTGVWHEPPWQTFACALQF
jgi:hypothetical protein